METHASAGSRFPGRSRYLAQRADPRHRWLGRLFGDELRRPEVAWENFEDLIYHDVQYGDRRLDDSPELCAFMHRVWVFNRAMKWVERSGSLFAYSVGDSLELTGHGQVSAWHTGRANRISQEGTRTRWHRGSSRRRDGLVMPDFQFHRGQHPNLDFKMVDASTDWQVCLAVKGRSGLPLWHSGWMNGPAQLSIPVDALLSQAGFDSQYAEVHLAVMAWCDEARADAHMTFEAEMRTRPAVVAPFPIIRRSSSGAMTEVEVTALTLDEHGQRSTRALEPPTMVHAGRGHAMRLEGGVWKATVSVPDTGTTQISVGSASGAQSVSSVRIAADPFFSYDPTCGLLRKGDNARPLSGSYAGSSFVLDPGLPTERFIQGQADWDECAIRDLAEERIHHWDALTAAEMDSRFAYLEQSGWDVLHLHQHWSSWARLDAGGHLSPHGAEQAALFYRLADAHGLAVMQTLFDYPYGTTADRTAFNPDLVAPWSVYVDAGYQNSDWYVGAGTPFRRLAEKYIHEYVLVFAEESALLGLGHSGEADFMAGADAVNATGRLLEELGDRHLFYSEPVFRITEEPASHREGFAQDLVGGRTYWIGDHIQPTHDLAAEFKLMSLGKIFMAEGSWSPANSYSILHAELGDRWGSNGSWTGSLAFRTRLRDSLYLALVHGLPLAMTWDEQVTEDEHLVFSRVARQLDWMLPSAEDVLVIRTGADNATGVGREVLASYVRWAAEHGIPCRVESRLAPTPDAVGAHTVSAEGPFTEPSPPAQMWRIQAGAGYDLFPSRSFGGEQMVAYACNRGRLLETYYMPGLWLHRQPLPVRAEFSVPVPARSRGRVYDLNTKSLVVDEAIADTQWSIQLGPSTHDYLLVTTPKEAG